MQSRTRCRVLALTVAALGSSPAFGQAFQPNTGGTPGSFGTPYANLGLQGRKSWELYRKLVGPDSVVGSAGANATQASLSNQELGFLPPDGTFRATGQVLLGKTAAATPATDQLYLKDMTLSNGAVTPPNGGYDANLHGNFDLRIGFLAGAGAYVAAKGGDNKDTDLFGGDRGTKGVYFHLAAGNTGATVAGKPGNPWNVGVNGGAYLFGATSGAENALVPVPATNTLVSTNAPVPAGGNAGAAYDAPLEVSARMTADPLIPGNVVLRAKLGNNVVSATFNPNDPSFGAGGFAWQSATPVVYAGKGAFDNFNPSVAHLGVLAPGDANADGITDFNDLIALAQNYNTSDNPTYSSGDFTGDGTVDFNDLVIMAQNYNAPAAGPLPAGASAAFEQDVAAAFASVPEPTTPLAIVAVAALAARSRRRGRNVR